MEIGGDRFRRESTPVTVILGFLGRVSRAVLWAGVLSPWGAGTRKGISVGFHPNCTTLRNPSSPTSQLKDQNPAQVRAVAFNPQLSWFRNADPKAPGGSAPMFQGWGLESALRPAAQGVVCGHA